MNKGFLPGDELVRASTGQVRYQVVSLVPRIQSIKVLDVELKDERILEEGPLRLDLVSGALRLLRQGVDWAASIPRRQSSADDEAAQAAMRFLEAVEQLRRRYDVSFNKAHEMLLEQRATEGGLDELKLPSKAQAYRWWRRNRDGIPVHLGNATKGNRSQRYGDLVNDIIKDLADKHYLQTESPWRLPTLTDFINLTLHDARLLPANKAVSKDYVQRVIRNELHSDPEHGRMQPKDAIGAKAVAGRRIRISGVFERVEQDAVHLPFLVRTLYGNSKDVWLVHAIDCSTSVPVGWRLVIGAPRVTTSLQCVETILFPKVRLFERLGLRYDFDIYGTPSQLVLDNGPETKGDRIMRLARLSIDPAWRKSYHPHHKPFIERLNLSLKTFLEPLPGSTRVDGKDGQRDPAALGDPVMTLEELEQWIVRFYFEEWINNPLRRLEDAVFADNEDLGATPLERFRTLTEKRGYPVPLPPSLEAWRSVVFDQETRTLSRKTGISYLNYHFKGDRLAYLIKEYGETEVTILIDRDDFRLVHVIDRDGRSLVPLINASTSESTPAYSFDEADAMLKKSAEEGQPTASESVRRDLFNRSAGVIPKTQKSPRHAKKNKLKPEASKQTTKLSRQHDAIRRSASNPLPRVEPSLGHPPIDAAEEDWVSAPALELQQRKTTRESQ